MLFLLNQEIIDVGDPVETLKSLGVTDLHPPPSLAKLVALGQDAAFAGQGIENAHAGIRTTLAAMLSMSGQVNCAIFLYPARARAASEVAYRLGFAPLTTMAFLLSAQIEGRLSPALINEHVWRVAPGEVAV